jgi:nitroreductase
MAWPRAGLSVFEAILARRSVRSYRDADVDRKTIRTLLEAGVRAPTAGLAEPWAFVIVQGRRALQRLSSLAKPLLAREAPSAPDDQTDPLGELVARPDFNIFHGAGTLIVVCAHPTDGFAAADCWMAAENMMLTACALGLGTCVIGSALPALERLELKAQLGIPPDYAPVVPLVVGYPRNETQAPLRQEPLVLAWK